MHKLMLKFFDFLKNIIHFFKFLITLCIVFLTLYWIQNLISAQWSFLSFITPFLDNFISIGELISKGSINLFAAVFEFKYMIAVLIFVFFYLICRLLDKIIEYLEHTYSEGRRIYRRMQEETLNTQSQDSETKKQLKIKKYQIYIETFPKGSTMREKFVNMEEQNHIMNKFMIEKTGITPQKFEDGFIYSFDNFIRIDAILKLCFRLLNSRAPIDFVIIVNTLNDDEYQDEQLFKKLINLKIKNKITMLAKVAYRYNFNPVRDFNISQLGNYKSDIGEFEVHEFKMK